MTGRKWVKSCRAVLAMLICAPSLLASCRKLADVEERSACDGLIGAASPCSDCVRSTCCDAAVECQRDPLCADLWGCLSDCPPKAEECRSKCRNEHRAAFGGAFAKLASCASTTCSELCGGYVYPTDTCASCAADKCGNESSACAQSEECLALTFCQRPCASWDHACKGACEASHEAGALAAREFVECLSTSCVNECGYENGPVLCSWPGGTAQAQIQWTFTNGATWDNVGIFGAKVRVCGLKDTDCTAPIDEQTDQDDGAPDAKVSVTVPDDFDGYFELTAEGMFPLLERVSVQGLKAKSKSDGNVGAPGIPTQFKSYLATPLEPGKGHLWIEAKDCGGNGLAGVSFLLSEPQPQATAFYGRWGQSSAGYTGADGWGGFLNLSPGNHTVSIVRRDTETPACMARTELVIRKDAVTNWQLMQPGGCGETP